MKYMASRYQYVYYSYCSYSEVVVNDYIRELNMRGWCVDLPVINVLSKTLPEIHGLTSINMWNAGLNDESLYCLGMCLNLMPSVKVGSCRIC